MWGCLCSRKMFFLWIHNPALTSFFFFSKTWTSILLFSRLFVDIKVSTVILFTIHLQMLCLLFLVAFEITSLSLMIWAFTVMYVGRFLYIFLQFYYTLLANVYSNTYSTLRCFCHFSPPWFAFLFVSDLLIFLYVNSLKSGIKAGFLPKGSLFAFTILSSVKLRFESLTLENTWTELNWATVKMEAPSHWVTDTTLEQH